MKKNALKIAVNSRSAAADQKEFYQTVRLLQMEIDAIGKRNQEDFRAISQRLARLLPREDTTEQERFNQFTTQDWKDFLNGKLKV